MLSGDCWKRFRADSGSIVPLLAVVVLLVLMMGALVGATAQQYRRAAGAQWAADAVALAVAAEGTGPEGRRIAAELATANDAVLRSITTVPPAAADVEDMVSMVVVVEVEHRGAVAFAAAARFESGQIATSSDNLPRPIGD